MRALRQALGELLIFVANYVDDISLGSSTFHEHVDLLDHMFEKLVRAGFKLQQVYDFFVKQSNF